MNGITAQDHNNLHILSLDHSNCQQKLAISSTLVYLSRHMLYSIVAVDQGEERLQGEVTSQSDEIEGASRATALSGTFSKYMLYCK